LSRLGRWKTRLDIRGVTAQARGTRQIERQRVARAVAGSSARVKRRLPLGLNLFSHGGTRLARGLLWSSMWKGRALVFIFSRLLAAELVAQRWVQEDARACI